MIQRYTVIGVLVTLALVVFSCTDDKVDPSACDTIEVTYNDGVADILNTSCAVSSCHVNGVQAPLLEDFASASNAASNVNFLAVINHDDGAKAMPPGGKLDQCQIDIITAWIADGSPE